MTVPTWLTHPQARVRLEPLGDGRHRVVVEPTSDRLFVACREWTTRYPVALIERILEVKGPAWVCDEIMREENPSYVENFLQHATLGFVPPEEFENARVLDFGSGSGASTAVLARLFPGAEIVGVELEPDFIDIARRRAEHYGLHNTRFLQSPDPTLLPDDLGTFRHVNLGAVYEHLLPEERRRLVPQLWSVLDTRGVLFVNQLPYRYYLVEQHTTGLPFLNYVPDRVARVVATRLSKRVDRRSKWPELLRAGIRGGTEKEILEDITRGGGVAQPLVPAQMGLTSHVDLWYGYSNRVNPHPVKRVMRTAFTAIHRVSGAHFLPSLSLAYRKAS